MGEDLILGGTVAALAAVLFFFFHDEVRFLAHAARHHWTLPRVLARTAPAVDTALAVVGGLAVVAAVHFRRAARRARPRAAAAYRAPAPHFGRRAGQCGVPGSHRVHDPADDPVGAPRASDARIFRERGYVVVRGLLGAADVAAVEREVAAIVDAWPVGGVARAGDAPETPLVAFDPAVVRGDLAVATKADGVRRLFRMATQNAFFANLCRDARFTALLEDVWGPDVALLQSMALVKPPGTGEKRWHQDQGYFRLAPSKVAAYWVAIDATDAGNGCMHVVPGSHRRGTAPHGVNVGVPPSHPDYRTFNLGGVYYAALDAPAPADVVAVPMRPGDALLFDGDLLHATPPNASKFRRRAALQFHYASAACRPTRCPRGGVAAPNEVYGPTDAGFDCAPETAAGGPCTEPQFWFYRRAELVASGKRHAGCI